MASSTPNIPVSVERRNNSTPVKRTPLFSPVRNVNSAYVAEKQQTPLSHIHRFVHSGVQLLTNTPGKNKQTADCGYSTQLTKDGRTHFLTPLSVNSSLQVVWCVYYRYLCYCY